MYGDEPTANSLHYVGGLKAYMFRSFFIFKSYTPIRWAEPTKLK